MKIHDSTCGRHRRLPALILVGGFISMSPTLLTAADVSRTTVTVRVCQAAGLPSRVEQRALAEAKAVLRAARVEVRWRQCTCEDRDQAGGSDAPPEPSELVLRMIRTGAHRQGMSVTLGDALVNRHTGAGVLATVYVHRVAWLADAADADSAVLLGRVTAHELGHLLMRTNVHARVGLMRRRWTLEEIQRNSALDWMFTAADVAAMRSQGRDVRNQLRAETSH